MIWIIIGVVIAGILLARVRKEIQGLDVLDTVDVVVEQFGAAVIWVLASIIVAFVAGWAYQGYCRAHGESLVEYGKEVKNVLPFTDDALEIEMNDRIFCVIKLGETNNDPCYYFFKTPGSGEKGSLNKFKEGEVAILEEGRGNAEYVRYKSEPKLSWLYIYYPIKGETIKRELHVPQGTVMVIKA